MKYLLALSLALLIGCAQLGVQAPSTFQDKAYAAALTIDSIQKNADFLLNAKKITPDDADNVAKTTAVALQGITVARTYMSSNPAAANSKLDAAVATLTALTAYLNSQANIQGAK